MTLQPSPVPCGDMQLDTSLLSLPQGLPLGKVDPWPRVDPSALRLEDDYDLRLSTHRVQRSISCPEEAAEFACEAREEFQVAW